MIEFKVGDRVRLIENYGKKTKGYEGVVEKVKDIASKDIRERGILCEQMVHVSGELVAFNFRFELVERPWEFEVGKYYRNIERPDHIVCVIEVNTRYGIKISVIQSSGGRVGMSSWYPATDLKKLLEPCEMSPLASAPKVMIKKSGWVVSCVGKNSNNGLKSAISALYSTREEAVKATRPSWQKVTYHQIEWEEEAKVEDDDMV